MTTCTCGHFRSAHHFIMPFGPGSKAPCKNCQCRSYIVQREKPKQGNQYVQRLKGTYKGLARR
jgi:hypothetical protein